MVKLTFPRELRLLTPASFNFVFQQPLRAGSPFVTFVYRKNDLGYARLGFAVAKKQVKRAHERNRIKRLVRESFRLNQHSLPAVDLIVMARTAAVDLDNKQLMEQVDKLWQRIKRNSQNPSAQSA